MERKGTGLSPFRSHEASNQLKPPHNITLDIALSCVSRDHLRRVQARHYDQAITFARTVCNCPKFFLQSRVSPATTF